MKKIFILTLIIFISILNELYCQERIVSYTTQNRKLFSVPKGADIKSITDMDVARMEAKEKLQSKKTVVTGKDMSMEVIIKDLTKYEYLSDYELGIETTVLNLKGIEQYDYNGKLINSRPHEFPEDEMFYILPKERYFDYGFSNSLFEFDINYLIKMFHNENYAVEYSEKDSIFKANNEFMQLYINFKELFYETTFFEDKELKYIDYEQYMREGEYVIPYKKSLSHFEYLINGIRMMCTDEKTYLEYSVMEDGKIIYERSEYYKPKSESINLYQYEDIEIQNQYMKVYPNPAYNYITVELPYSTNEKANIEIINSMGNIVLVKNNINTREITIDISGLSNGTYIVNCRNSDKVQSVRIIKN